MKKVFVIASRVPFPIDKGDKLRIYHQVKELSKKYEVTLCVLAEEKISDHSVNELSKIAHRVEFISLSKWKIYFQLFTALFSSKPFQIHYFYQKNAQKRIDKLISEVQPHHIYCQLIRCAEYVKNIHHIPKTIDYMDTLSKGIERRIEVSGWKKPLFRTEFKRLMKYENLIFDYFDFHTIISSQDREYIMHHQKKRIAIVPNGIDTEYFKPQMEEKKFELVFVGNMSYPPNVDAMQFFVKDIFPLLKPKFPAIKLLIAGASPSKEIQSMQSDSVIISGWVEDIRSSYAQSRIFIAPLRIGTGLQNKLLEAMAMGIPCITSVLANNALKAKIPVEIIACNEIQEYVTQIELLLKDAKRREEMTKAARNFVEHNYRWDTSLVPLINAINTSVS